MKEEPGILTSIANFFATVFEYIAASLLAFVAIAFLLLGLLVAVQQVSWDNIFYYLPFFFVPLLVFLLFFFAPFSDKKERKK